MALSLLFLLSAAFPCPATLHRGSVTQRGRSYDAHSGLRSGLLPRIKNLLTNTLQLQWKEKGRSMNRLAPFVRDLEADVGSAERSSLGYDPDNLESLEMALTIFLVAALCSIAIIVGGAAYAFL
jgi:hypothetical protein